MRTISWRAVVTMSIGVAAVAACSSDDDAGGDETPVASSAASAGAPSATDGSTVARSTAVQATSASTAPPPTSALAASTGPEAACPEGESPLVIAYDRATGAPAWARCAADGDHPSLVGATAGSVYVVLPPFGEAARGTAPMEPPSPRLVALDGASGAESWSVALTGSSSEVAAPDHEGDTVVVITGGAGGAALTGLDAASGAERWRTEMMGDPTIVAASAEVVVATDPGAVGTVSGGSSTVPPATQLGGDERLGSGYRDAYTAFDRATGTPLWTTRLRAPDTMVVQGPPRGSASDDLVVVPLGPSALDLRDGEIVWIAQLPPDEQPTDPSIDAAIGPVRGGASLFGGQDDPFTVLDAASGQPRWTAPGSPPYDDVWAVDDGGVYLVDRDAAEIVAYDLATGAERWRQPQGQGYVWPWLAGGDTVFTMWWNLESRDAGTGEVRWHTDYPIASSPTDGQRMISATMNDSHVFVGFTGGTLGGD